MKTFKQVTLLFVAILGLAHSARADQNMPSDQHGLTDFCKVALSQVNRAVNKGCDINGTELDILRDASEPMSALNSIRYDVYSLKSVCKGEVSYTYSKEIVDETIAKFKEHGVKGLYVWCR